MLHGEGQLCIPHQYKDIAGDVEARFDTSGYSEKDKRPLDIRLNLKKDWFNEG